MKVKNHTEKLIGELRLEVQRLRFENLRMRLEIEQLTERPWGLAAEKIRRKYQRRRERYTERFLTIKN